MFRSIFHEYIAIDPHHTNPEYCIMLTDYFQEIQIYMQTPPPVLESAHFRIRSLTTLIAYVVEMVPDKQ